VEYFVELRFPRLHEIWCLTEGAVKKKESNACFGSCKSAGLQVLEEQLRLGCGFESV
jgi:hypothetical protein